MDDSIATCPGLELDEREQSLTQRRLLAVVRLNRLSPVTIQEITDLALTEAITLTGSAVGFVAFVSGDGFSLTIPSWSKGVGREKLIANRPLICSVESAGFWAEAMRQSRSVITNRRLASDLLRRSYPGGHGVLTRQMSVPVRVGGDVVAVAGVANKECDYTNADARQMMLLMEDMWRVVQHQRRIETLEQSEKRYRLLVESMSEGLGVFDENCKVTYVNDCFCRMLEYSPRELVGRSVVTFLDEINQSIFYEQIAHGRDERHRYEVEWTTRTNRKVPAIVSPQPIFDSAGNFVGSFAVVTDITRQKETEQVLKATNDRLAAEQAALTEKNIALKEIMSQIENEKRQVQIQIQANVDRILMPLLRTLKGKADADLREYVQLLESCLGDIASGFINQLETRFARLSPREVEICNMIKSGLSTKEIAATLDTSVHTVHNQRKQIRKKLEIDHRDVNLSSYLQTI
ncbi:MAG: PAS domain S-box protein [candidate division Zixibacteria bacterium]|nr:PAS domain S-box protein [candidate division Zixibacteria bacterium]